MNLTPVWERMVTRALKQGVGQRLPATCLLPHDASREAFLRPWARALASDPTLPRRLVIVCDRTEVVEATVERLQHAYLSLGTQTVQALASLAIHPGTPVLVTRVNDREWRHDPSRPTVVVGTPHDIGSGLLFRSPYDTSNQRPIVAGLLGHDAWILVDRGHVQRQLLDTLATVQAQASIRVWSIVPYRQNPDIPFESDHADATIEQALKQSRLLTLTETPKSFHKILERALSYEGQPRKIGIFLNDPADVLRAHKQIVQSLRKDDKEAAVRVHQLTGTFRRHEYMGHRRACMAKFAPGSKVAKTEYLVATSAAELGQEIEVHAAVCDVVLLDDMIQRMLRVRSKDACIDAYYDPPKKPKKGQRPPEVTLVVEVLRGLPEKDGGYLASTRQLMKLNPIDKLLMPSPPSDLLDEWSMTSAPDTFHTRSTWRYVYTERMPPRTLVAWRKHVEPFFRHADGHLYGAVLDAVPLHAREYLSIPTFWLEKSIQKQKTPVPGILGDEHGIRVVMDLRALKPWELAHRTVFLAPKSSMIHPDGYFDPTSQKEAKDLSIRNAMVYPCQDRWGIDIPGDYEETESREAALERAAEILSGENVAIEMIEVGPVTIVMGVCKPVVASHRATSDQTIAEHHQHAVSWGKRLVAALDLPKDYTEAILDALGAHDLGKRAPVWQSAIGNFSGQPLAKVARRVFDWRKNAGYAHEFGSMVTATVGDDLVTHLIAAHHGRSRPCFLPKEYDRRMTQTKGDEVTLKAMLRFEQLQRAHGRWQLAYLEAIVRAADVLASIFTEES